MKKPRVITNCVANHYARQNEKIIEFVLDGVGGLISFRKIAEGEMTVNIYCSDPEVKIFVSKEVKR